jgi:ferritin-like protein
MSMYHESGLSNEAQSVHRAIASLVEELEAVDWYNQRADVAADKDLRAILLHNRDEEIEHAAMLLEWLRRHVPKFNEELRTYLLTEKPITEVEGAEL